MRSWQSNEPLALGCRDCGWESRYATFHGQILIGPYADPNQVEAEAWAELRRCCAHLDRAKLTPVRRLAPFGALTLKVISADTQLPLLGAVASIHAMLVQADGKEDK